MAYSFRQWLNNFDNANYFLRYFYLYYNINLWGLLKLTREECKKFDTVKPVEIIDDPYSRFNYETSTIRWDLQEIQYYYSSEPTSNIEVQNSWNVTRASLEAAVVTSANRM